MTLIKSISGIRGTIGGLSSKNLTPIDIVRFTAAFGFWLRSKSLSSQYSVVVGRDARISGEMVNHLVVGTLIGMGINVFDAGLATTPTVEIGVINLKSDGGIIITASHNPEQWNALKLLNSAGEFISDDDGKEILRFADDSNTFNTLQYAEVQNIGKVTFVNNLTNLHINKILDIPLVDVKAIQKAKFSVVIDCVNSVGGIVLPQLLESLGVMEIFQLNCEPTGKFAHNPEPLPEHLHEISRAVKEYNADIGFVVDPDVDRLAVINEDGSMFGEEYTLVAIADYVLTHFQGNTVSNLSSTIALRDVTNKFNGNYYASSVGEVNVVREMKNCNAMIGGEGNGGIIYAPLHYGRDALVGIALFLSHLAHSKCTTSQLRSKYPDYFMSKNKIELPENTNLDFILEAVKKEFSQLSNVNIITIDGLKLDFGNEWIHLRKSNTEPIIRIYTESTTPEKARLLSDKMIHYITPLI